MPMYPTYFDRMRALNRRGPRLLGRVPRLKGLQPHDVEARHRSGQAVVDMRSVRDYARGHIPCVYHMEQLRDRLESGEPLVVVDVRQAHEWSSGHIPQAKLVEAGPLPSAELQLPRDALIATHCGHGQRAATAAAPVSTP